MRVIFTLFSLIISLNIRTSVSMPSSIFTARNIRDVNIDIPDEGAYTISLIRDDIGDDYAYKLSRAVSDGCTSLHLKGCVISQNKLSEIMKSTLASTSHLVSLRLIQCALDDETLRLAAVRNVSLPLNKHLRSLDVSFNPLSDRGLRHLSALIARLPSLDSLSLSGIHLSFDSFRAIIHSVRKHQSISSLSLSACQLSDECLPLVAILLKSNPNITTLDLSRNIITAAGIDALGESIRAGYGKAVESLDLSYNDIGDHGCLSLSRSIENNQFPSLKRLVLREIGTSSSVMHKLLESFQSDTILESIDLSGNSFSPVKKKIKKNSMKNLQPRIQSALQASLTSLNHLKNKFKVKSLTKRRESILLAQPPRLKHSTHKSKKNFILKKVKNKIKNQRNEKEQVKRKRKGNQKVKVIESEDIRTARKISIRAIYTFLSTAKQLKHIGLCRVGLDDITIKEFTKQIAKKFLPSTHVPNNLRVDLYLNNITADNAVLFKKSASSCASLDFAAKA